MDNKDLGLKLKELRIYHKMLQTDISSIVGKSSSAISRYEKGEAEIPATVVIDLCNHFGISIDEFLELKNPNLGFDSSLNKLLKLATTTDIERIKTYLQVANGINKEDSVCYNSHSHKMPLMVTEASSIYGDDKLNYNNRSKQIPVRGHVAAGKPIEANDNIIERINLNEKLDADYALIVNGNSMHPIIEDGEYVYVKSVDELNNNDIGVFYYNGSVTCKKFFKNDSIIKLISINPGYEDFVFYLDDSKNENINFKIEGKVILSPEQQKRLNK